LKTIKNKTLKPLRISFSGGRVLHLGPAKTGQIADTALAEKSVRKLIDGGQIEVVGGETQGHNVGDAGGGGHEAKRGHPQSTSVTRRGDR